MSQRRVKKQRKKQKGKKNGKPEWDIPPIIVENSVEDIPEKYRVWPLSNPEGRQHVADLWNQAAVNKDPWHKIHPFALFWDCTFLDEEWAEKIYKYCLTRDFMAHMDKDAEVGFWIWHGLEYFGDKKEAGGLPEYIVQAKPSLRWDKKNAYGDWLCDCVVTEERNIFKEGTDHPGKVFWGKNVFMNQRVGNLPPEIYWSVKGFYDVVYEPIMRMIAEDQGEITTQQILQYGLGTIFRVVQDLLETDLSAVHRSEDEEVKTSMAITRHMVEKRQWPIEAAVFLALFYYWFFCGQNVFKWYLPSDREYCALAAELLWVKLDIMKAATAQGLTVRDYMERLDSSDAKFGLIELLEALENVENSFSLNSLEELVAYCESIMKPRAEDIFEMNQSPIVHVYGSSVLNGTELEKMSEPRGVAVARICEARESSRL